MNRHSLLRSVFLAALTLVPTAISAAEPTGRMLAEFEQAEGRFMSRIEIDRHVRTEKIEATVSDGLKQARAMLGLDAKAVQQDLKLLLNQVLFADDLPAASRSELRRKIELAIREAARVAADQEVRRAAFDALCRCTGERQRTLDESQRRSAQIEQLMDRFGSLMDETNFGESATGASLATDAEDVAIMVQGIDPSSVVAEAAVWNARIVANVGQFERLRELRDVKWTGQLYQSELSSVPFPDEPPITYPPADVWEELTRRREKYRAMDLARPGAGEEQIFAALDEQTTLEFIETPLQDVVMYLEDLHRIEIEINSRALEIAGIGSDTPITRNLRGITLRSALRLLLKDLELTYIVQDEVLQITTPEEAEANLVTKVYPVGDLVVPIGSGGVNPFMQGGGLMGQGMNSGGNQRNGFGQNGLGDGFGAGMRGGAGFGRDGGFF